MSRPRTFTVASGSNKVFPVNWRAANFGVGFTVNPTGGASFSVEHTFDDIYTDATPVWHAHSSEMTSNVTGAAADGNYAYPVRALRLTVATAGSAEWTILQND